MVARTGEIVVIDSIKVARLETDKNLLNISLTTGGVRTV